MSITIRVNRERFWLAQKKNRLARQIVEQRSKFHDLGLWTLGFGLQNSQFARRRQRQVGNFTARNLCERIELAQRFQFVAEKFQPHGPRTRRWKNVHDAAAQRDLALLRDLRLRLVALRFEPFDQIERRDFVAARKGARAVFQIGRRKGFLQQRGHARHHQF